MCLQIYLCALNIPTTNKAIGHEQCWRHPSIESSHKLKLGWRCEAGYNSRHISQAKTAFIIFEDTSSHAGSKGQDDKMPLHHGLHSRINRRHQFMVVCQWCLMKSWAQEVIPKPLEMKLACKYQWGSFFDHQDGWCNANKQRRTTLCRTVRGQRQSRRNLSLHL